MEVSCVQFSCYLQSSRLSSMMPWTKFSGEMGYLVNVGKLLPETEAWCTINAGSGKRASESISAHRDGFAMDGDFTFISHLQSVR